MPMLTKNRVLAVFAWLLGMSTLVFAQAPPAGQENFQTSVPRAGERMLPPGETIHRRVDEVNIVFTVTDPSGHFVGDLSPRDFTVLDEKQPPERLILFQQKSELPLRVGVLIDLSLSVAERLKYEKAAAMTFLQTVFRPGVDQAFVVGFASRVIQYQDMTGDMGAIASAVQDMRAGGDTRFYDAIRFASRKLGGTSSPDLMRRAIIVITDGDDTLSKTSMYDAIQWALRSHTAIYALSTNSRKQYTKGDAALDLIARATGGEVLPGYSNVELARSFERVKDALHNQYVIAYKPRARR